MAGSDFARKPAMGSSSPYHGEKGEGEKNGGREKLAQLYATYGNEE